MFGRGPFICEIPKHAILSALLIGVGHCTFHLPPDMITFTTIPHLYLDESTLLGPGPYICEDH